MNEPPDAPASAPVEPARIPRSQRASLGGDVRIAVSSLNGVLRQLLRTRRSRMEGQKVPGATTALWITSLAFLAMVAYWGIWFFVNRDWLAAAHTSEYYAFENAFPLADGWMALASLLGAIALVRRRPQAMLWMLIGGGASVYLGCMDVLFDLEHGIYLAPTGDWGSVAVEIAVNLATLLAGAWILRFAWTQRAGLLQTKIQ